MLDLFDLKKHYTITEFLEATLEGECWNMSIIASEHNGFLIFCLSLSSGI